MTDLKNHIAAARAHQQTLQLCQQENEMLIKTLRFYAESDWRTVAMVDRGERAKKILQEVGV
jgi:hypothetical protein